MCKDVALPYARHNGCPLNMRHQAVVRYMWIRMRMWIRVHVREWLLLACSQAVIRYMCLRFKRLSALSATFIR